MSSWNATSVEEVNDLEPSVISVLLSLDCPSVQSGDCLIKHPGRHTTGMAMVGAVCDWCEAFICHGHKCLSTHPCVCPLRDAECFECKRAVWDHGGRIFKCSFCQKWLCEDDQFEHQASCQQLDSEDYKCMSCNRLGQYTCMRCKICFCEDHVRRKGVKYERGAQLPCPKCHYPTSETKDFSVSSRKHAYGRQGVQDDGDDYGQESIGMNDYGNWRDNEQESSDDNEHEHGDHDSEQDEQESEEEEEVQKGSEEEKVQKI